MQYNASDIYLTSLNGSETIRVGVGVALIDEYSRLLLELRSDVEMWGITGGKLDPGETTTECAKREIQEETGLHLTSSELNLIGIYSDPRDGRILQYPDNRVHLVDIVYTARIKKDSRLIISSESIKFDFFSANELPKSIVPPAVNPIEELIKLGHLK